MPELNLDQEKSILFSKLEGLSGALKKLAASLTRLESERAIVLLEQQMVRRIVELSGRVRSFKSLEEDEGELFASLLKSMTDIVRDIGALPKWCREKHSEEAFSNVLSAFRILEGQIKEFLPIVISIDESRKKKNFETFGGLLQKLTDMIQEKRHLILKNTR